jgi:hypothetical protein
MEKSRITLLSLFKNGRELGNAIPDGWLPIWEGVLGVNPYQLLRQFVKSGKLVPAPLSV